MQMVGDKFYEDLYRQAMDGISYEVAMRTIRKVMRDNSMDDKTKLMQIACIVKMHEEKLDKEDK